MFICTYLNKAIRDLWQDTNTDLTIKKRKRLTSIIEDIYEIT